MFTINLGGVANIVFRNFYIYIYIFKGVVKIHIHVGGVANFVLWAWRGR